MSNDIINLVGNLIMKVQQEKKDRYNTCGCARCKLRANDIETWLNPDNAVNVPEAIYDETPDEIPDEAHHQEQAVATVSTRQVWLCHSCLRKASAASGRCPYCGTGRHIIR